MASKKALRYDREKARVWGSADYLLAGFDDIAGIRELTRKCKDTKAAKAYAKRLSTPKDNLAVGTVFRTVFQVPGGEQRVGLVARVNFGLNGRGEQKDYFDALSRLVDGGAFRVFDAFVDAIDDVASVLCTVDASRLALASTGAEVRIGAGCKSGKPVKPAKPAPGKGKADA